MSSMPYSSADEHKDHAAEDLERLVDAFGSMFSLEDMLSAYWESNKDVALAGERLFTKLNSQNNASDEVKLESHKSLFLELPYKSEASNSSLPEQQNDNSLASNNCKRGKKLTVSSGLVPGIIGKDYARSEVPARPTESTKPMKIDLTDFIVSDEALKNESKDQLVNKMHKEVEDFLFQMLGSGFQFDVIVIREVLGQCGYDVKMGMEKLLDLSASTLEKSDDIIGASASNLNCSRQMDTEYSLARESHRDGVSSKTARRTDSLARKNNMSDIEKEVLVALFSASNVDDDEPDHCPLSRRRPRCRSGAFGTVVTGHHEIVNNFRTTVTMEPKISNGGHEHSYEVLRQAVKEYWVTMKEYYKAAFEAFSSGDLVRSNKLMDQGHFFSNKAKEADAKSAEMLFRAREEVMSLDLRDYTPTEAKRLTRSHLTTVCGISSIVYLKLRIGTEAEDKNRVRRKKIVKELEAESIEWTEENNGEIISIRVDGINPQQLSFVKTK